MKQKRCVSTTVSENQLSPPPKGEIRLTLCMYESFANKYMAVVTHITQAKPAVLPPVQQQKWLTVKVKKNQM